MSHHLIVGAFVLMGSLTASAQNVPADRGGARPPGVAPANVQVSPVKLATKNPYARLFPVVPAQGMAPAPTTHAAQPRRKTVCGLTVWNVTPELDPRSVLRPGTPQPDYKISKLAPPVCTD